MRQTFTSPLCWFVLLMCFLHGYQLKAQKVDLWLPVTTNENLSTLHTLDNTVRPRNFYTSRLNLQAWKQIQSLVPSEAITLKSQQVISLPLPDGSLQRFSLLESPLMEKNLAARYPHIKTYSAQGIDDPTATARLDWTPAGLHAIILTTQGTYYIDPYSFNSDQYMSYHKKDYVHPAKEVFNDIIYEDAADKAEREHTTAMAAMGTDRSSGTVLRTYRIAIATTGEYTSYHGGTVEKGLTAVITTLNRVNAIFEKEVAIRMILVNDNDKLIFTDPDLDPYTNNNGISMIYENQTILDSLIGSPNYDIGHVFSTGGGGIASLGSPCREGSKAKGVTGSPHPLGDPFDVDYVAHEIGHQFGANHTFNGNSGFCGGGTRNSSTAYEPGSGSTIMGYAGICSPQNLQANSDDYFHSISFDEIFTYTTAGRGSLCGVQTATGNTPPVAKAGSRNKAIPIRTPFKLTGGGSDADGDQLTYCWEQFDRGPAGSPESPESPAPLFRSLTASLDSTRTFPRLTNLLSNTKSLGEVLPTTSTRLHFRLTVRDNKAGGGGVNYDTMSVDVIGGVGPFVILNPNSSLAWTNNSSQTITWEVAGTDKDPVNCQLVHILFSSNGGRDFLDTLAAFTPNDGSQEVTIPNVSTNEARIKIEAADNIFFDISDQNFIVNPIALNAKAISQSQIDLHWTNTLNLSCVIERSTPSANNFIVIDTVSASTYQDKGLQEATAYYYRIRPLTVGAEYSNVSSTSTLSLPPAAPDTLTAKAISQSRIQLEWKMSQSNQTAFIIERSESDNKSFAQVANVIGTATAYLDTGLKASTTYYYRIKASNNGGSSAYANEAFATTAMPLPAAPSNLAANTVSDRQIDLTWTDNADNEDGYVIYRSSRTNTSFFIIDSVAANVTQYSNAQLLSNVRYFYVVRSYNSGGLSNASNQADATTHVTASTAAAIHSKVTVYPNPADGLYNILVELPVSGPIVLKVWDQTGRLMKEDIWQKKQFSQEWPLNLLQVPAGIYNLQLILPDGMIVKKLVKH